ncbi:Ctr copper transporter family-domain-containing protein [Aspergillus varians]
MVPVSTPEPLIPIFNPDTSKMDMSHSSTHPDPDQATNMDMDMAMAATFTSSTKVTLFFSSWTTTSPLSYTFTLLFLFALAFFNRFLAAMRFQLEHNQSPPPEIPTLTLPRTRHRHAIPKARQSPLPPYMQIDQEEIVEERFQSPDNEERSGLVQDRAERPGAGQRIRNCLVALLPRWTPKAPWSWCGDGGWAVLEGVRAFIGYILMLAVMTFNTGIFCAVLGGIVFGEMVLGRYMQRSSGVWHDGACHDG